jgi:superoxide dismutase, Fe-Mn family
MDKREFIKTGFFGTLGLLTVPAFARNKSGKFSQPKKFQLPELPYAYDALEPYIDKETMMLHHDKHHAAYTDKFNAALSEAGLTPSTAREILIEASKYNAAIVNNGGGYFNHKIFWKCLSPTGGGNPTGKIGDLITRDFGSYANFKELFTQEAKNVFGSGWTWLVTDNGTLKIVSTANQYSPIMDVVPAEKRGSPLLCLDVWEHAYYLKYQNRRAEYIDAFWNIVNWETANNKLDKLSTD